MNDDFLNALLGFRRYRIFLSHSWAYGDQFDRLIQLLNQDTSFQFSDHSVPRDDPIHYAPDDTTLRQAIAERIRESEIVLVLAGVYATHSKWMDIELNIAKAEGLMGALYPRRPVLAVRPFGNIRISTLVQEKADEIVGWRTDSVTEAIRRLCG